MKHIGQILVRFENSIIMNDLIILLANYYVLNDIELCMYVSWP